VVGYHRNIFVREFFKYIDIDPMQRRGRTAAAHCPGAP
jgi:hypothetical protein